MTPSPLHWTHKNMVIPLSTVLGATTLLHFPFTDKTGLHCSHYCRYILLCQLLNRSVRGENHTGTLNLNDYFRFPWNQQESNGIKMNHFESIGINTNHLESNFEIRVHFVLKVHSALNIYIAPKLHMSLIFRWGRCFKCSCYIIYAAH